MIDMAKSYFTVLEVTNIHSPVGNIAILISTSSL